MRSLEKGFVVHVILFFFLFIVSCNPESSKVKKKIFPTPSFPKRIWLNSQPLTIESLRGKIVFLYFFTYSNIYFLEVSNELKKLENKWKKEVVIIGVYSGRFTNEQNLEHVKLNLIKYGILHPVIYDPDLLVWSLYGISKIPSFVLIDPEGNIYARKSGRGGFENLDTVIRQLVKEYDLQGKLNLKEIPNLKSTSENLGTVLFFPSQIDISKKRNELYITDFSHKIFIYNLSSKQITEEIGNKSGFVDGNFTEAYFQNPNGIRFKDDFLWVADTGNHSIRKIDLVNKKVSTIVGRYNLTDNIHVLSEPLFPFDLDFLQEEILVTMAGNHQIWKIPIVRNKFFSLVGSGEENLLDGDFLKTNLAQPTGIKLLEQEGYFLDSQSSSLRKLDFKDKSVKTLIGKGLFEFGDTDGDNKKAKLQYPLGLTYGDKKIFICDTFNHKIKVYDPQSKILKTLAGNGKPDWKDGKFSESSFNEPSGLVFDNGSLFVVDTNNHSIRKLDLKKEIVETLNLHISDRLLEKYFYSLPIESLQTQMQEISPEVNYIELEWKFPKGFVPKPESKIFLQFHTSNSQILQLKHTTSGIQNFSSKKQLQVSLQLGEANLITRALILYCHELKPKICMTKNLEIKTKYKIKNSGDKKSILSFEIPTWRGP